MNNPLSAFNTAAALQEFICEALAQSKELTDLSVSFIPENSMQVDYLIKKNLMQ